MTSPESSPSTLPAALLRTLDRWLDDGPDGPLVRLLGRALDEDGVPREWPVEDWWPVLECLERARKARRSPWPEPLLAVLERFFLAALRFSRHGGASPFGTGPAEDRSALLKSWAKQVSDPTLAAVVDRWFPRRGAGPGIPALPAYASVERPLAVLRPDWNAHGDLLAIDHRRPEGCRFSVIGRGQAWLGPGWEGSQSEVGSGPRPRPRGWQTGAYADFYEWSFASPGGRKERTAVLLRGRGMALIAEQAGAEAAFRVGIPPGVKARPVEGSRGLILSPSRGGSARLWPIGLSAMPSAGEGFGIDGGSISYTKRFEGRRGWLPMLISWDADRNRRPAHWRPLTVTEDRKVCRDDRAVAWRVSWGREETLVVYRSLGRPASRCFLGHQTKGGTRFLMAEFDDDGDFRPLLTVMA
ncbi:MAG: hypothetical protein U0800_22920 [Isosphaeraceae bacterium]